MVYWKTTRTKSRRRGRKGSRYNWQKHGGQRVCKNRKSKKRPRAINGVYGQ